MNKIYKYELRRTILNKFYLVLLLVGGFYAKQILESEMIMGINHTAPFSLTSFIYFTKQLIPFAVVALLFLMRLLYTKKTQQMMILVGATQVDTKKYFAVKCGAVVTGWWVIQILIFAEAEIFLNYLFPGSVEFLKLTGVGILILLLTMIVTVVIGIVFGKIYLYLTKRNLSRE